MIQKNPSHVHFIETSSLVILLLCSGSKATESRTQNTPSARIDIRRGVSEKYDQAMEALSLKDYAKSIKLIEYARQNWSKGNELPPLSEAQKAYTRVHSSIPIEKIYSAAFELKKQGDFREVEDLLNHIYRNYSLRKRYPSEVELNLAYSIALKQNGKKIESEKIFSQYSLLANKLETQLKEKIEQDKIELAKTNENDIHYGNVRMHLAENKQVLAHIYFLNENYKKAESLLQSAFVDAATIAGRQCLEAVSIAKDIERVSRMSSKNPKLAQTLTAVRNGHPPVTIKINPAGALKKLDATEVCIVLEDQFGCPSTNDWWLTKSATLQGMKAGKIFWKKNIPLNRIINMDATTAAAKGSGFVLTSKFPGDSNISVDSQEFSWDGRKITFKK